MNMKKILFALVAAVAVLTSCSDKIYHELNTDPTKPTHGNPSAQLTYAELQAYGHMPVVDTYRLYHYAFTQHLMGCWNTTYYGGQHRIDDNTMQNIWGNLYQHSVSNLVTAINQTDGNELDGNINAALRVYKVYVFSLITDMFGHVPYFDAGKAFVDGTAYPAFDRQDSIYYDFFRELDKAQATFSAAKNPIESDAIYNGDIESWKRFAASLRLRLAMRISDVDPVKAEAEATKAVAEGVFTDSDEEALVKHALVGFSFSDDASSDFRGNALSKYFYGNDPANNPSYVCSTFWQQMDSTNDPRLNLYCRFYIDDWMSVTSPDGRVDITQAIMNDRASGKHDFIKDGMLTRPGEFSWDSWPSYSPEAGSELTAQIDELAALHEKWNPSKNPRYLKPKIANNFMKSNNPGVIMTYAEVLFLKAEAASKGWSGFGDARSLYEQGIRAAMNFVTENYYDPRKPISDEKYQAYLQNKDIAWDASRARELINTQAWILHFNNPAEAWANQRRSGYPDLKSPAEYQSKNPMINGREIPKRLLYPTKEAAYNELGYADAMKLYGGTYDWNVPMWWDK